jgi:hypothetical protein
LYCEQHSPAAKPRQVKPAVEPHEPSAETPVGVATAPLDVGEAEAMEEDALVYAQAGGVNTYEVATLSVGLRYQFASGSPMHSPIVTPL